MNTYLFFTLIFDATRLRTVLLETGWSGLSAIQTVSLATKMLLVVLEAMSKATHIKAKTSPEATSGVYGLSFFTWLLPLIYRGSKHALSLDSLDPVDETMASRRTSAALWQQWSRGKCVKCHRQDDC